MPPSPQQSSHAASAGSSTLANSPVFTSESVTEGHPDKVCDQISDAILDEILTQELHLEASGYTTPDGHKTRASDARVACETMVTEGQVFLAGEIRTAAYVDIDKLVRTVVRDIGYHDPDSGFHYKSIGITNSIHEQSHDIARGVDASYEHQHGVAIADPFEMIGAGDQGMVFGFACTETDTLMPMPLYLAQRLAERLALVRKEGILEYLRPDGKTQVSVRYQDGRPQNITTVLISSQHQDLPFIESELPAALTKHVLRPVLDSVGLDWKDAQIHVNPTGRFVLGGPAADTGLTGRKIIVDSYGGYARHGGGAFSGKDCTKVDRSAAYAARWVAKNIVASGLALRAEVQIAYGIGIAEPLSLLVECFNTNTVAPERITAAVRAVFDLRPAAIISELKLLRPIFRQTATYGHFGRALPDFTWEQTDRTDALLAAVQ